MSFNINKYTAFASNKTKSYLILDLLQNNPELAIEALNDIDLDNSSKQEFMSKFSKIYLHYIQSPKQMNEEFHHVYLEKLKESFSILVKHKEVDYTSFYTHYALTHKVFQDVDFLVGLVQLHAEKDKPDWLEQVINQIESKEIKDVIVLSEKSKEIIKNYFKYFNNQTKMNYITYTDIYPTIKSMLDKDFFEKECSCILEIQSYTDNDEILTKTQLIMLSIKYPNLSLELLEDLIHETKKETLEKIIRIAQQELHSSTENCENHLFDLNELMFQKINTLESNTSFNHIKFCSEKIGGRLHALLDYFNEHYNDNHDEKSQSKAIHFFKYINSVNSHNKNPIKFFNEEHLIATLDSVVGMCQVKKEEKTFLVEFLKTTSLNKKTVEKDLIAKYEKLLIKNHSQLTQHFSTHEANCVDLTEEEAIEKGLINLSKLALEMSLDNDTQELKTSRKKIKI